MVQVNISPDYGYVVFVAIGLYFLNFWLGINVGKARKTHKVDYPLMYSDKNMQFNCIQRTHQNYLEYFPFYAFFLLFGGYVYPCACAISGVVFIAGRIVYTLGYYTGDPAKRNYGAFQHLGLLVPLISTIQLAVNLLGWI